MTLAFSGRDTLRLAGAAHMTQPVAPRPQQAAATLVTAAERPRTIPCHDARALTGPAGTAEIVLDGQVYCLRITRAGKLILTK